MKEKLKPNYIIMVLYNLIKKYKRVLPVRIKGKYQLFKLKNNLNNTKRTVYVDCGSNLGQGYEYFKKFLIKEDYNIYFFEPNPFCMEFLKKKYSNKNKYKFFKKAIWTRNGELKFFGIEERKNEVTQGGSIVENHNDNMYISDNNKALTVECINFSEFLVELKTNYEQIIVKMDIESAEYEVLDKILDDRTVMNIDLLIIEFHSFTYKKEKRKRIKLKEKELLERLNKLKINTVEWY